MWPFSLDTRHLRVNSIILFLGNDYNPFSKTHWKFTAEFLKDGNLGYIFVVNIDCETESILIL